MIDDNDDDMDPELKALLASLDDNAADTAPKEAAKGDDEFGVKIITNISGTKIYTTIEDIDIVVFLHRVKYFILKTDYMIE